MRITSKSNERLKLLRAVLSSPKHRRAEGLFAVEGSRAVLEALARRARPHEVFLREAPRRPDEAHVLAEALEGMAPAQGVISVAAEAFDASLDVTGSVDAVALFPMAEAALGDIAAVAACECVLVAENVQDPGNLGGLMRTAYAAGGVGLVMVGACADPLSPKVVRAAAGAVFGLPMAVAATPREAREDLPMARHLGAAAGQGAPWDQIDLRGPVALWLGGEACGLSADAWGAVDGWVHIPIVRESDSLNVAIAAAILTFEHVRQRRAAPHGAEDGT